MLLWAAGLTSETPPYGFVHQTILAVVFILQGQFSAAVCAGKYVELEDTISSFKDILAGKYDDLPEMAFYMVGDIKEVEAKADKMAKDMAAGKK